MLKAHRFSGWPGAYCLDCGSEDPYEIAIADDWYEPYGDIWDSPQHKIQVEEASICKAPVKNG